MLFVVGLSNPGGRREDKPWPLPPMINVTTEGMLGTFGFQVYLFLPCSDAEGTFCMLEADRCWQWQRSFSDEHTGSRQICLVSITLAVVTPTAVLSPASSVLLEAQGFFPYAIWTGCSVCSWLSVWSLSVACLGPAVNIATVGERKERESSH